jgi:hypothetical protein
MTAPKNNKNKEFILTLKIHEITKDLVIYYIKTEGNEEKEYYCRSL